MPIYQYECEDCGPFTAMRRMAQFRDPCACPECGAEGIMPVPLSHSGSIYTFTIVRMPPPGYVGETPYAVGLVELPEGLRVASTITKSPCFFNFARTAAAACFQSTDVPNVSLLMSKP